MSHLPIWPLFLAGLFAWQGWMTASLFDGNFTNDQPVLSGSHPQHLYLGSLGALALQATGRSCCYDPNFQAGYPKTPVFNGSRWAEVFLFFAGGGYQPQAYKWGLAILCLSVPCFLILAARSIGLGWLATFLAAAMGQFLWWGPPSREALEAGASELLVASLAVLTHTGLLIRFHHRPGFWCWLGLILTGAIGWFSQPMMFPIALPLLLIYYLHAGPRHASLTWHAALFLAELMTVFLNAHWLFDWVVYWWLRAPSPAGAHILKHRTFETIWNAPLWGTGLDRGLGLAILLGGFLGVVLFDQNHQRTTARLLGLGSLGLLVLAILGISWEPLGQLGTSGLLTPALWFAVLPAAHAAATLGAWLLEKLSTPFRWILVLSATTGAVLAMSFAELDFLKDRLAGTEPLKIGLGSQQEAIIALLKETTTRRSRILWEDRVLERTASRWSPLLPYLTQRAYLGGLDPETTIEHSQISFVDQALDGKFIGAWTDKALEDYCQRYNVGWIVAWTPAAQKRLAAWPSARKIHDLEDQGTGMLFAVEQAAPSYALKGRANIERADSHHILLTQVVPQDGQVVLSLHFQKGMKASPSRVVVEREPCWKDPIGYVRLKVANPVACVTLTWGDQ